MTLFKLCEWEINGYSDSDWILMVYDDETNSIKSLTIGTTRFAGCAAHGYQICYECAGSPISPTQEIIEKARLVLKDFLFQRIKRLNYLSVMEPEDVNPGDKVQLLIDHKNQAFEYKKCENCINGQWINPKNPQDKRDCFSCYGEGEIKGNKLKQNNKLVWLKYSAGLTGTVKSCRAYGTFYKNGYNQPGRDNKTVIFVTENNKIVRAPLSKLRLAKNLKSDFELLQQAEEQSKSLHFGMMHPRFTWYDKNYVSNL